jgi:hypothetical protein
MVCIYIYNGCMHGYNGVYSSIMVYANINMVSL